MATKVKEGDLDLAKRLNERISFCPGVTSAVRKQYLESARGHYLSALAGLNAGKQESTNICDSADPLSILEDHALEHATEEMSIFGQLGKDKTFDGMKMVKFLKVELENLKKEHAELKDKGEGEEFVTRNLHFKLLKSKPELKGCPVNKVAPSHASELIHQDQHDDDDCKVEGKGLKRENETPKFLEEMAKKRRVAPSFDKAKETMMCNFDQNKCMPGKPYDACVSTSESSVRVRFTEDELESSSQKAEMLDKPERNKFTVVKGQVDFAKHDHSSEFSIRDYVFSVRNKDISTNWPFSQKNLQLCLKHGVKNILPPFQSFDSMANNALNKCLIGSSLHSEESKLEERSLGQKRHMVPDLFPCMGEKELDFKSTAISNSHSEVDSVSTNILQPSEVSDEQVAAPSASASASAPAVKKMMKSSTSQASNKKCKVSRGVVDDITSACTAPAEAMASKICPVCQIFSSSSNTTLNAHIDQCLSSQSPPNWMNNSKVVKPRIKARKMRSMADICATAPCCTLEDLDRRNGTNWATNAEFLSQDTDVVAQGKGCGVSERHVNNGDDGSVYIDSNGRKIRILSKFNDISSSSLHKVKEDARPKKQSKFGKAIKFFAPKRKGRLGKHLKYLKVSQKRKILSYRKIKRYLNEVHGSAEATSTWGEKLVNGQQQAPFVKASRQKNVSVSGTLKLWISSKRSNRLKKNDPKGIQNPCRQASNYLQPGSDPLDTKMVAKKPCRSPKTSLRHLQSGVRTCSSYQTGSAQNSENSSGSKALCSRSMEPSTRGNKDPCLVPMKLGAVQYDPIEEVSKSADSAASPTSSIEREVEFQAEAGENVMDSKRSVDPESQNVIDISDTLLKSVQYFDPLPSSSQLCSSDDDDEIFHGRGVSTERLELETGVSDFDACQHLFPEVDPIPIPGPPGSDLPSFSDMDSEVLHRTSSLDSSLALSSGNGDDEVNGNQSDPPLSATSLVSNLGISADPTLLPPEYLPSSISGSNNVYPGWSFGHTSDTYEMFSEFAATGRERTPSQVENSEDKINVRGRSHPTLNFEESQVLGQKMETFVAMPTGELVGSTLNGRKNCLDGRKMVLSLRNFPRGESDNLPCFSETSCQPMSPMEGSTSAAVSLSRAGDCDSANPAPILRLMGKDLMVVNKAKDDMSMERRICTNRQVHPVPDLHHGFPRSWQHQPHQPMSFTGPLVHSQVPDIVSMQHFEGGSSDMILGIQNNCHK